MRLRGITVDVADRERAEAFWGGLLDLEVATRYEEYSYFDHVVSGVRLILQVVDDLKVVKNRVHLDLESDDPVAVRARIVGLGGSILGEVENPGYSLTLAADPDGNEFCVARRLSDGLA